MLSADAPGVLRKRLRSAHLALETLSVQEGFAAMASFYREERADDVDLEDDGDMLLVQWGAEVVAGHTPSFKVDMTRKVFKDVAQRTDARVKITFEPT